MKTKDITVSACLLALGLVLPFLTGQIPSIGNALLPMHYPVFLCGFIVGPIPAMIVGFLCPLLRSMMFTMPPMYPVAIAMAFELSTYGLVTGILFNHLEKTKMNVYVTLIISMLIGRCIWGIAQMILLGMKHKAFTFAAFIAGGFTNASIGIVLQIIIIPVLIFALCRAGRIHLD